MRFLEILTILFLSLALVSSSEFGSGEVTVSNALTQSGYHALPSSELRSLLRDAVSKDDPNQVRTLLENHIPSSQDEFDINTIVSDQGTLLHWTADRGHSDLVPVLLIRGADINSKLGQSAMTPLMHAAKKGHDAIVTQFLNALATDPERMHSLITTQDMYGRTALHHAATYSHDAVVAQLLNALAANPERMHSLITIQNMHGYTALHYAARGGHDAVIAQLLNALAADPERMHSLITTQNSRGWTLLHYAAYNGHEAVVALLLNALATRPELVHSRITTQDDDGQTALHYAAYNGHEAVVALLLNALATRPELVHSLIIMQDSFGWTALHYAAQESKTKTVKVLLERYKEALDEIASDTSSSAAGLSSTYNDFVKLSDQEMSQALNMSVTHNCVEIIDLLAQLGANLDVRDKNGNTHLHRAARTGRSVAVSALVENNAESQRDNAGKTPHDVAQGLTLEALNLLE